MQLKRLSSIEVKDETKGEVTAVFATLGVKDKDDDVTNTGAFTNGQEVIISSYGHGSWDGALPVGKGVIREVGNQAVLDGQFFLNTTQGRDTFEVVKQLGDKQEWSYGFNVDDSEQGEFEGKSVRYLKKMTVYEVSPVIRGAGEGTRTVSAKSAEPTSLNEEISAAVAAVRGVIESAGRVAALRAEKGKGLSKVNTESLDELRKTFKELKTLLAEDTETKTAEADPELYKLYLASIAANLESE